MAPAVRIARAGVLFALLGVLPAGGCLFEPRRPESTGGNTTACFSPVPADQDIEVFFNVEGAMRCKIGDTYQVQFASDFVFIPAQSVRAAHPDVFADPWTKDDEIRFASRLFAEADTIAANLDAFIYQETRNGSDPVSFDADYVVRYVPRGGQASVYRGKAKYTLRTEGGTFVISMWDEQEPADGDLAFGQLRGELFQ